MFGSVDAQTNPGCLNFFVFPSRISMEVLMLDEAARPQDVVGAAVLGTGCLALSGPRCLATWKPLQIQTMF